MKARRMSYTQLALLKSQVNAIGVVERQLRTSQLSNSGAAEELRRIQSQLYRVSQTKVRSTL